ncbi:MAG: MBOAT family protein [Cyanobacteria bacterium SBC]|nr:MBOAT family protein [Cyanobacteria bacterium SBC]
MLFNSYVFIFVFLPVAILGFFTLSQWIGKTVAKLWLTVASFIFYGHWNVVYVPLLIVSISLNYITGNAISKAVPGGRSSKFLLGFGVVANLGIIGYYKYANFFVDSANHIFKSQFLLSDILLPLAISFYTFTQIAYLVDAYRGETRNTRYSFLDYSLFVVFFPQLIAGPILRHNELIPQLKQRKTFIFSCKNFGLGLVLFSLGLSKKVLIADNIAPWISPIFNHAEIASFIESWVGALSYTFQLYFDFSGYSDMAIGLGLMFNINLPINFNSPYKAVSIVDFWRRWHITLSNFLRDYLYISLGGNRHGSMRRYLNLFITMLLGGLWHGAGWTFVLWGGLHGVYLAINHFWKTLRFQLLKSVGSTISFIAVVAGWVLFRSNTISDAIHLLKSMFGLNGIVLPGEAGGKLSVLTNLGFELRSWNELTLLPDLYGKKVLVFGALFALWIVVTQFPNTQQILQNVKPQRVWAIGLGLLSALCLLSLNRVSEFLYFQF